MIDKNKYLIFPERTYTVKVEGHDVEVSGQELIEAGYSILNQKLFAKMFPYYEESFDSSEIIV
jgi:hypothetical protein